MSSTFQDLALALRELRQELAAGRAASPGATPAAVSGDAPAPAASPAFDRLAAESAAHARILDEQARFSVAYTEAEDRGLARSAAAWSRFSRTALRELRGFTDLALGAWQGFWSGLVRGARADTLSALFVGMLGDMATQAASFFAAQGLAWSFVPGFQAMGAGMLAAAAGLAAAGGALKGFAAAHGGHAGSPSRTTSGAATGFGGGSLAAPASPAPTGTNVTIHVDAGAALSTSDAIAAQIVAALRRARDLGLAY